MLQLLEMLTSIFRKSEFSDDKKEYDLASGSHTKRFVELKATCNAKSSRRSRPSAAEGRNAPVHLRARPCTHRSPSKQPKSAREGGLIWTFEIGWTKLDGPIWMDQIEWIKLYGQMESNFEWKIRKSPKQIKCTCWIIPPEVQGCFIVRLNVVILTP